MKRYRLRRSRPSAPPSGFTLIEVLLVLIILVVIGSIVAPNMFGAKEKADINVAKAQISFLKRAMKMYRLDMGSYPNKLEDLREKPSDKDLAEKWTEPYLDEPLGKDPWNNEYQFLAKGKKNPDGFDLWSNGPDGKNGTDDDIGNWE
ncbi:type II secretion system major pseudopilin GspG [Pirellulales bacterium]|nr:type II secretion system major pseudopilin GspG [Pirellulales bacterium]